MVTFQPGARDNFDAYLHAHYAAHGAYDAAHGAAMTDITAEAETAVAATTTLAEADDITHEANAESSAAAYAAAEATFDSITTEAEVVVTSNEAGVAANAAAAEAGVTTIAVVAEAVVTAIAAAAEGAVAANEPAEVTSAAKATGPARADMAPDVPIIIESAVVAEGYNNVESTIRLHQWLAIFALIIVLVLLEIFFDSTSKKSFFK